MSDQSSIQWTDSTWNIVTGCTRVSPGCARCYIERTPPFRMQHRRFATIGGESTTGVVFHRDRLDVPMRWRKPRRIFTCSLGDLFHEAVDEGNIRDAFTTMARAPQHTFQVLTKRPERAARLFKRGVLASRWVTEWPLPNVWMGTSIENARFTWRADALREIPAAVRFISAEPLLDSLYVQERSGSGSRPGAQSSAADAAAGRSSLDLTGIDWVIAGGESGPGARGCDLAWIRELRDAAAAAGVAFFVKQLGARAYEHLRPDLPHLKFAAEIRDRKGGDIDEWPADLRIREFPLTAVPA